MKSANSHHGLLGYTATLVFWVAVSCAAIASIDVTFAMIGILTLALLSALALLINSSRLIVIVSGAAILLFGFYSQSITGLHNLNLNAIITFSAAVIGTTIIASQTRSQIMSSSRQVERDRLLIEELRINDSRTGLMRFHYARRTLSTEISRGLRFGKTLSLLVMRIDRWDELAEEIGMDARENLLAAISEILFGAFRNIDTLYLNIDKIGVILPETTEDGAINVANRVIEQVYRKTKTRLFVGITSFPNDSIADEELFRKGELALSSAIRSGKGVYPYSKLVNFESKINTETQASDYDEEFKSLALDMQGENIRPQAAVNVTYLTFSGIDNLNKVDPIQKSLVNINEFRNIRLIDFKENELVFTVRTESEDIQLLLAKHLKIDVKNISTSANGYLIAWNGEK